MTCPPEVLARTFRLLGEMLLQHLSCCVIGLWLSSAQLKAIAPYFDTCYLIPPTAPQQRNYLEQETQDLIPLLKAGLSAPGAESDTMIRSEGPTLTRHSATIIHSGDK